MSEAPWYRSFFDADYFRRYGRKITAEHTEWEVANIIARLGLPPGSKILDLACGHGRHSIGLAQAGYQVTGLDLSEVFLDRARTDANRAGVDIRWVHSDIREIPFENEFDAVINIFTAFGYLESEEEDQRVLRQIARALKPGGAFLIETINRDGLFRRYLPYRVDKDDDGRMVLHEHVIDLMTSRIRDDITVIESDGSRQHYHTDLRLYTGREFVMMFEAVGLYLEAAYGGLDGSGLALNSRRMVLLARTKPR